MLDPFVLPAPTTARFWLLILATLASAGVPVELMLSDIPAFRPFLRGLTLTAPILFTGAVLATALVIWWRYPTAKIRYRRFRPLPASDLPELAAFLGELCDEVGIGRRPTFLWNPLQAAPAAVVFGRLRANHVGLSGGLVVEFSRDRAAFRAIVLHELAHIRNRDVALTSFTVCIWWSFVGLVFIPLMWDWLLPALVMPTPFGVARWTWIGTVSWRVIGLTLLVYLTRNSVLRTRELYADVRTASWDGPTGALRRVLDRLRPRNRPRWWPALGVHPDPSQRRRCVDATDLLFTVGFWEAFGAGCAVGLAETGLTAVLITSGRVPRSPALLLAALLLPAIPPSFVAAAVIGPGLWRSALAALRQGRRPRGWVAVGLGLGAGLVLGADLSLNAVVEQFGAPFAGLRPTPPDVAAAAVVVGGSLLVARWIAGAASAWLAWRLRGAHPGLAYVVGLGTISVVLGSLVALGFEAELVGGSSPGTAAAVLPSLVLSSLFFSPQGVVVMLCLWAFPLAAEVLGNRPAEGPTTWAFLDSKARPTSSLRRELTIGLVGGLVYWPLYFGILVISWILPGLPGALSNLAVVFAVMQAVVSGIVASRGGPPSMPRAILAAFVAASVTAPLALLISSVNGASLLDLLTIGLPAWLGLGVSLGYVFALLAAVARATSRLVGPHPSPPPKGGRE